MVHGMKRSGNHAIVNWLVAQGQFVFLNNVIPIAPVLQGIRSIPEPAPFNRWFFRQFGVKNVVSALRARWRLRERDLIVSLEDHDLNLEPFYAAPVPVQEIVILRDPANLFASRIRKASRTDNPAYAREPGEFNNRAVKHWKQHAHAFLNDDAERSGVIGILYDAWCQSSAYRQGICERLGLTFTDAGLDNVPGDGGGSSFEGTAFDGRGQEMAVTRRAEMLEPQERDFLESILADEEMATLSERLERYTHELVR
ncbi:hypothetical protein [Thiosocius teredinicola]|uniref:hypothetical protein n=1 Tax=Thiosocius teredinicola TaxID=1973002 RepID=UPI000990E210